MPSSFSRFLSPQELERVRELYFESLKDEDKPKQATGGEAESSKAAASQDEKSS
jgi:hypothetical protein